MNYSYTNSLLQYLAYAVDAIGNLFFKFSDNKIDKDKVKKIIFVKIDNIGDCFLTTPIFSELKKLNKNIIVDVLCLEASKEIFINNNSINSVICIKDRSLGRIMGVRKIIADGDYNIFIDARGYARVALLGFLSGIKIRIGFMEEVLNCLYTHKLKFDKFRHESEKYGSVLKELGLSVKSNWVPRLNVVTPEIILEKFNKRIIAIHPGASLNYKRWPIENWINLLNLILQDEDVEIAVLGSKNENELGQKICKSLDSNRVINLVGGMSISQAYGLISNCFLFIGSDSVLGHFAGAQSIPTIILMNSVIDESRWRPLGSKVKVISVENKEHKCLYDKCPYPCPNMKLISVECVLNEIEKIV